MSASKISESARMDIERQIDHWLDNFGTCFGEQWGGGACEGDLQGLLVSAKLHKELARCALAFAAKHGLKPNYDQAYVDSQIDECIEITKEDLSDSESEEEDEAEAEEDEAEEETIAQPILSAKAIRYGEFGRFIFQEMKDANPGEKIYFKDALKAARLRWNASNGEPTLLADKEAFAAWQAAQ